MNILMVHPEFCPTASGVARHLDGLARALVALGHGVEILAPETEAPAGAPYGVVRGGIAQLPAALRRADALHAHGSRKPLTCLAMALAAAAGRPVVYTPHCYYDGGSIFTRGIKRLWDRSIEAAASRSVRGLVALDDFWVDDFRRRGLAVDRCTVVPNCLDMEALSLRRAAATPTRLEGAPAVLSVGRLDPVKRLDDVIAALAQPLLAGAVLHVVGRGDDRARLEALARTEGVAGRVRFHGWRNDDETMGMMLGCDAMVLASEREGLPTILLETLAVGVPMIHSDIAANIRVTRRLGWDGAFPLGDRVTLARRLADRAGQGVPEAVSRAVGEHYSWQAWAPRLVELYRGQA